jgi:hypothetical protein
MNYLEKFQGWLKGKVQAASTTASAADATTLPPAAPSASQPSRTQTTPVSVNEMGQLPNTLAEIPDPAIEEDWSTASIWAQILCGSGRVRSQRVRSAAELEKKRLNGACEGFEEKWGLRLD